MQQAEEGYRVQSRRWVWLSILAWVCVWSFWLVTTRNFHPTFALAVIVTTTLTGVYAAAAYANHLILIPRYLRAGRSGRYAAGLLAMMLLLTAAALAFIRVSYTELLGITDAELDIASKHFAIDLFGMVVHLVGAAAVVWAFRRVASQPRSRGR